MTEDGDSEGMAGWRVKTRLATLRRVSGKLQGRSGVERLGGRQFARRDRAARWAAGCTAGEDKVSRQSSKQQEDAR